MNTKIINVLEPADEAKEAGAASGSRSPRSHARRTHVRWIVKILSPPPPELRRPVFFRLTVFLKRTVFKPFSDCFYLLSLFTSTWQVS